MKVAFHVYGFGLRGTEVATYDYAHFNRTILGHESVIVAPASSRALLENFRPDPSADWDVYSERYSPQRVMAELQTVFLDSNGSYETSAFARGLKH